MQLLCGKCGRTTEVDDQTTAEAVVCASCRHEIPVPGRGEGLLSPPEEGFDDGFALQARQAMVRKIRVVCGSCGRGLKASMRMAGTVIRCPACERRIRVPFPDESREQATAEEVSAGSGAPIEGGPAAEPATLHPDDEVSLEEPAARNLLSDIEQAQSPVPESLQVAGSVAVDQSYRAAPQGPRGPSVPTWILLSVVGAALLLVGVWVFMKAFSEGKPAPEPTAARPAGPRESGETRPLSPDAGTVKGPPVEPRDLRLAAVRLLRSSCDVFAAAGFRAAPPGMVYLQLRLSVSAGDQAIQFALAGSDVQLTLAGQAYPSLGEPGPFALGGARRTVSLPPNASAELSPVFLVPEKTLADAGRFSLAVAGIKPIDAPAVRLPAPGKLALDEPYREAPPRNLQPMLRDPVMRAIQSSAAGELLVRRRGESLVMSIPAARVSGTLTPASDGTYTAALRCQGDSQPLTCTLRVLNGGARLVLYLASEPFHQICYAAPAREPEPVPVPVPDKPAPVPDKPAPPPLDPPKGSPGGFFGTH